jgi:hypothetical protein
MMNPTQALIDECKRCEEGCGYTAPTFYIWLRILRLVRALLSAVAVVCAVLAARKALLHEYELTMAIFALVAAALPPLQRALGLDAAIDLYAKLSSEFTNLEGSFRRAAAITSQKPFDEFEAETAPLFARLDKARSPSVTPPEFCFRLARRKKQKGHYTFDYDEKRKT